MPARVAYANEVGDRFRHGAAYVTAAEKLKGDEQLGVSEHCSDDTAGCASSNGAAEPKLLSKKSCATKLHR
jgi:1,2-phenylacetyl-CoA epoxidase catalytic subunit